MLATQVVPSDMLYCLWKVGRAIYELAEGYAEANEERAIDEAEARGEDVAKRRCVCSQGRQLGVSFAICLSIRQVRLACAGALACDDTVSRVSSARSQKAAQKSKKEGIGADDFVPIFLFVTIHAELPTPFQICTCIKRFASDTERNSEVCTLTDVHRSSALTRVHWRGCLN
jgi:hypothetical protein